MTESSPLEGVRRYIAEKGIDALVRVLPPESTKTSESAARTLECTVAEIAKTICFIANRGGLRSPVLVTLSGARHVSTLKLAEYLEIAGSAIHKMSADEVKLHTGYSIGGVPPFPHSGQVLVLADESLFHFSHVWAAAGTSNSVIRIDPQVLNRKLNVPIVHVSQQKPG